MNKTRDPLAKIANRVDALETAYQRALGASFLSWKRGVTDETTMVGDHFQSAVNHLRFTQFDTRARMLGKAYDRAQRVEMTQTLRLIAGDVMEVAA